MLHGVVYRSEKSKAWNRRGTGAPAPPRFSPKWIPAPQTRLALLSREPSSRFTSSSRRLSLRASSAQPYP